MEDKRSLSLDGIWEFGFDRNYTGRCQVPGLCGDPSAPSPRPLWLRREIRFPADVPFTGFSLLLKGARFCPRVYLNGDLASSSEGGMGPILLSFSRPDCVPGAVCVLEVELCPLDRVPETDASCIPQADHWRTSCASCLWDSVILFLHGGALVERILPYSDPGTRSLRVRVLLRRFTPAPVKLSVWLEDRNGERLCGAETDCPGTEETVLLSLPRRCGTWSPDDPQLFLLSAQASCGGAESRRSVSFGLTSFTAEGTGFFCNGVPAQPRGLSVVWHRFLRDPEARRLAFDAGWFEENIVRRLRSLGGNFIRFHLGLPPESFLDLCDRYGIWVQLEWSFFHNLGGSPESLRRQWAECFALAAAHPCVILLHLWNEYEGPDLAVGKTAAAELRRDFPPVIVAHLDTLHFHKYWWSLFENVGIYYDSCESFGKPVVADEFGGNYLDGKLEPGEYPSVKGAFQRFLGPWEKQTVLDRLELQTAAVCRVAEYWRRVGAAAVATFCSLGSPQDGCHHFVSPLALGMEKPVWAACAAAWSPVSANLELWDRSFLPGEEVHGKLWLYNDTGSPRTVSACLYVSDPWGSLPRTPVRRYSCFLEARGKTCLPVSCALPSKPGSWRLCAELEDPRPERPVRSVWKVEALEKHVPACLQGKRFYVLEGDPELTAFLSANGLWAAKDPGEADVLLGSGVGPEVLRAEEALDRGCSVLLTQVGPQYYGPEYPRDEQGDPDFAGQQVQTLPYGIRLRFSPLPEPESCLHPTEKGAALWEGLPHGALRISNGLRGGINLPAVEMEVNSLSGPAFLELWERRGADPEKIRAGRCVAYQLGGQYAFAGEEDPAAEQELRDRVEFLIADAPALRLEVEPDTPADRMDLGALYRESLCSRTTETVPLVCAGTGLRRTAALLLRYGEGRGSVLLSQIMTRGRLHFRFSRPGPYGVRWDPEMEQLVLNQLALLCGQEEKSGI